MGWRGRSRGEDDKNRSFPGEKKTERQVSDCIGRDRSERKTRVVQEGDMTQLSLVLVAAKRKARSGHRRRRVRGERDETLLLGEGTPGEKVAKGGNKRRSRMSGN